MEKRKIAVIIGSKSDLPQCGRGLELLEDEEKKGSCNVVGVYVRSLHRNTHELQRLLVQLSQQKIDFIIAGAGWANALTGFCDAYLRNALLDDNIVVVGVAFSDSTNNRHTMAARLGIECVPGSQVVFNYQPDTNSEFHFGDFIGAGGFYNACLVAVKGKFPLVKLPQAKLPEDYSLHMAAHAAGVLADRGVFQDEAQHG